MARGGLHGEHGAAGILNELVEDNLVIVVVAVLETGKGAHTDDVAIATHYGNGFEQVFGLVAIHDDATFGFQLPGTLVDVEHNDIHAQVKGCFLGAEAGTQAGIEENHHQRFITSQFHVFETVFLNLECFGQCCFQVADVLYTGKVLHKLFLFIYCFLVGEAQYIKDVSDHCLL